MTKPADTASTEASEAKPVVKNEHVVKGVRLLYELFSLPVRVGTSPAHPAGRVRR